MPPSGPKSETGASVTEIEYLEARRLNIPVLPFVKNLGYDADRTTDDAKRRDAFRKRVMDWESGLFVSKFDRAFDLAENVTKALIEVMTDAFLKARVKDRVAETREQERINFVTPSDVRPPQIPGRLIHDVLEHRAILLAGAGMSTAAGLPTTAAFAQYLHESIRAITPEYAAASSSFASAASDFEALMSRESLTRKMGDLLDPPQGLQDTATHRTAVQVFDQIFTTNWDNLLEQALRSQGDGRPVITGNFRGALPAHVLVKLHGSLDDPASLLVTEADVSLMENRRANLWAEVLRLLRDRTVVVVGTSLRDPSIVKLLEEASPLQPGFFVAPDIDAATVARVARWNLTSVRARADELFEVIAVNKRRKSGAS